MLSYPDFKEKQLLLITGEEFKKLALQNDNLVIKDENDKIKNKISIYKIFTIFVVGDCSFTTKLINKLLGFGVSIYILGYNMNPKFVISSPLEGNYLLRQKQYNFKYNLEYAKQLIYQKTSNQLEVLRKMRNKKFNEDIKKICQLISKIDSVENLDSLRGIEGNIAKIYFKRIFGEFNWEGRFPRTKIDITNFLLDMGYTYLFYFIEANLNLYGFDIYKGVFHTQFFERKSLVCDLQEPFRPIIDKKIKNMYKLKQIDKKDFKKIKGVYTLNWEKSRKYSGLFLEEILKYKEDIFKYIKGFYLNMIKEEKQIPVFKI